MPVNFFFTNVFLFRHKILNLSDFVHPSMCEMTVTILKTFNLLYDSITERFFSYARFVDPNF